jgi:hypothetical protein
VNSRYCTMVQYELPWLVNATLSQERQRVLWSHLTRCHTCHSDFISCARVATQLHEAQPNVPAGLFPVTWWVIYPKTCNIVDVHPESQDFVALSLTPLTVVGDVLQWVLHRVVKKMSLALGSSPQSVCKSEFPPAAFGGGLRCRG